MEETRTVNSSWDLSSYKWTIDAGGLRIFVDGLKDKKILGIKCNKCGTVYVPGPAYCRKCFNDIDDVVEVSSKGKISTFTVNLADIRGNPLEAPTISCMITLDGSHSYIIGTLEGVNDWHDVKIGMPVEIVWRGETKGELADIECFRPIT